MKYGYTEVAETRVNISFTANDLFRMIKLIESSSCEEHNWFKSHAITAMRETIEKLSDAMKIEAEYIKEKNNV